MTSGSTTSVVIALTEILSSWDSADWKFVTKNWCIKFQVGKSWNIWQSLDRYRSKQSESTYSICGVILEKSSETFAQPDVGPKFGSHFIAEPHMS